MKSPTKASCFRNFDFVKLGYVFMEVAILRILTCPVAKQNDIKPI